MQNSSLMLKKYPRKLSIADLYSCPHDVGKQAQNKQQLMGNLKKQLIAIGTLSKPLTLEVYNERG